MDYRALIESFAKNWFEELGNIDDPVYGEGTTLQGQGFDGKLQTKKVWFFEALAGGMEVLHGYVTTGECKKSYWDPNTNQPGDPNDPENKDNHENKPFTIYVPIAGALDQTVVEAKELKEMIELAGTILSLIHISEPTRPY